MALAEMCICCGVAALFAYASAVARNVCVSAATDLWVQDILNDNAGNHSQMPAAK